MKLIYITFLLFFGLIHSQEIDSSRIECKYFTKFLIDTTDISTSKEEMTSLLIGDRISLFKSDAKATFDSLSRNNVAESMRKGGNIVIDFSNIPKAYFIQEVLYKKNKATIYDKILKNVFAFESQNKINWKLIDETKTISNYICKKAVGKYGKRIVTAWYTQEIPFQEGPYNFKGLPGLIVEAYDDKNFYHFILKSLKKINKPIIPIKDCIETDYTKFSKKRHDFKEDPIGAFNVATGRTVTKDQQARIIKLHQSKNNYLE
ncbi:GLPGLI family protein [Chryseobacterium herbae]|uniref:GLPGLI family protein n=1 Tax=Chryseobacterium herbae TaxID=2976476 RepID=A0ABT2ISV9_9FLAO|nr:GLPGLI family protein [Chryseobacterium sp. pc1-10]MCT2561924.1 GLPGLI family protein [Chryseobacterium sp. pc1-10]